MIKLVAQKRNECYLAVVAMLSGKTIKQIRYEAHILCRSLGYLTYDQLWHAHNGNWYKLEKVLSTRYHIPFWEGCNGSRPGDKPDECTPTLDGRGTIEIVYIGGTAHIVAFENGYVFDSIFDKPLAYKQWLKKLNTLHPIDTVKVKRIQC